MKIKKKLKKKLWNFEEIMMAVSSGGSRDSRDSGGQKMIMDNGKYVRYTPEQVEALERLYHECPKPSSMRRQQLIRECPILSNIEPKQIKVWFQNRRSVFVCQQPIIEFFLCFYWSFLVYMYVHMHAQRFLVSGVGRSKGKKRLAFRLWTESWRLWTSCWWRKMIGCKSKCHSWCMRTLFSASRHKM